jgi:hypothetical protein
VRLQEQVEQLRRRGGNGRRPAPAPAAASNGPQRIGALLTDRLAVIEQTADGVPFRRRGRPPGSAEERDQLAAYLGDFAKELHDGAPLAATITRVLALFRRVGVPRETWGDYLYRARAITQEHSAQITTPAGEGNPRGTKNKVPYFLAVLEDLLRLKDGHRDEAVAPSPPT